MTTVTVYAREKIKEKDRLTIERILTKVTVINKKISIKITNKYAINTTIVIK